MADLARNNTDKVDVTLIARKLWSRKSLFIKIWILVFVLSSLIILPIPRYYTSSLMLVPESGGQSGGSSLGSLASSLGLSVGSMSSDDAFFPEIYPDVISSNEFIVSLFDIHVVDIENTLSTDYYTYRTKHEKKSVYRMVGESIAAPFRLLLSRKPEPASRDSINPLHLDRHHDELVNHIRKDIVCNVSKMTNVITISVTDQDPLISATLADSVRVRLQAFITEYRTKKARLDADYYKKLCDDASQRFEEAQVAYSTYCDTHNNIVFQSEISERNRLENEYSNALNTYNALNTQYQAAAAKVQERTPSFTILQRASVPVKPAGPKRVVFVLVMLFLSTCATSVWIMRREVVRWF